MRRSAIVLAWFLANGAWAAVGVGEAAESRRVPAAGVDAFDPAAFPRGPAGCARLVGIFEEHFREGVLGFWFPRCIDRAHGGFLPSFLADGSPGPDNDKTLVFQSRMTWIAAQVVRQCPDAAGEFRTRAEHGVAFLDTVMWDKECGGFFWALDPVGNIKPGDPAEKHAYGIAFGIYAAAAAAEATGSEVARGLAQRAFLWLDEHAHDAAHGGYFEALDRRGRPIAPAQGRRPQISPAYGLKSMNAHIHLLEALTALHAAWPDPNVKARLNEVFEIVRDRIAVAPGCLHLFFHPDWRPVPDHDSFGHDIETAFLLLEAQHVLKRDDEAKTLAVARSLVDHGLDVGWDETHGGFYDYGTAYGKACGREKIWWTQAEGLNALLLMHERFGRETPRYYDAFLRQWAFIWNHQIDHRTGEWHNTVSAEGTPVPGLPMGSYWKAAYHNGRALLNCAALLRKLAREAK